MRRKSTSGWRVLWDILVTAGILAAASVAGLALHNLLGLDTLVPTMFVVGVFLVSFCTRGYVYGIVASLFGTLAVNFAFTFPYFELNFTVGANFLSSVAMLLIACMTSALTTKVKRQEKLRIDSQRETMRANLLRAVSHDLRTPLTTIYGSSSAIIENYDRFSDEQKLQLLGGIRDDA